MAVSSFLCGRLGSDGDEAMASNEGGAPMEGPCSSTSSTVATYYGLDGSLPSKDGRRKLVGTLAREYWWEGIWRERNLGGDCFDVSQCS